ncbi:polysaccharide lyase family 1 protein [Streptomyces violaceorubidus]
MSTRRWHVHAMKRAAALAGCTALVLSLTAATAEARPGHHPRDTARQTLPAGDGWASHGTGTTGGAAADAERVYTVSTWAEFRAALAVEGTAPRIIKVEGTVDAVSEGCEAFAAPGYDFGAYLEKYSPESWGRETDLSAEPDDSPRGPAPRLRRRTGPVHQGERPLQHHHHVGVGRGAALKGASLQIKDVDNVIVRNLTFESPVDCFPQWDPTDGDKGNWNCRSTTAPIRMPSGRRTCGRTTTPSPTASTPTARRPPTSACSTSSTTASWTS